MTGTERYVGSGRRGTWTAVLAALVLVAGAALVAHGGERRSLPGGDAPSSIVIAAEDEPGVRLLVRGRVFAPDGQTPVEGVVLYAYQTGQDGRYGPPGEQIPRLRGWVRTDEEGRYEYRTIRPGSYPGRAAEAHIHVFLWGAGYEPQWTKDLHFADDPLVDEDERRESRAAGRFGQVCWPEPTEEGELLCVRDYQLKPEGDRFSDEIDHAFQEPGKG